MAPADDGQLLRKVVDTIRASSTLAAQDVDFHRSLSKVIGHSVDETSSKIVGLINYLTTSIDCNSQPIPNGKESLEESWKDFSNIMDSLFELSDRSMDILTRTPGKKAESENLKFLDVPNSGDSAPSKRMSKPQLNFKTPINNSESHPFIPLLREKPFAIKPLDLQLKSESENEPEHYGQPYEYEIDHQEYGGDVVVKSEPVPSKPWETTEAVWIDTIQAAENMVQELKSAREIAVDLEHHDYRSYYGIVCLMQISTRNTDYLVDTIALRDDLQILNEIFANPHILKVFHGAFMDIIWLQRDLGLYVVSLFDTFHASRALGLPRHSLAYLLERFARFKTSKKYQLADWRVRPLSKAMNAYARADTHFLLNIYDQMKNTLIEQNKLAGVLAESRNVAKRRFEYSKFRPLLPSPTVYCPIDKSEPWKILMFQYNISPEKEDLIRNLYEWRDTVARRDDESPRYVMPNQLLVELAVQAPTQPIHVISVNSIVTDYVRSNSLVLANLIKGTLAKVDKEPRELSVKSEDKKNCASSLLTIPQIKKLAASFAQISESLFAKEDKSKDRDSYLYFADILSSENDAVAYEGKEVQPLTNSQLVARSAEIVDRMKQYDDSTFYCIPAPEAVEDLSSNNEKLQPPNTKEVKDIPSPPPLEDKNEIITLKKVKREQSQPLKGQREDQPMANAVDYTKSEKVLGTNKDRKKEGKKRKFDPYSASNHTADAPRVPKKRKPASRGKNVSFKR